MDKRTAGAAVVAGAAVAGVPAVVAVPRMVAPAAKLFSGQTKVPFIGVAPDTKKQPVIGRGAPPPVPPNKPVVPPKKDTILCRRGDASIPSDDSKSNSQTLKYGINSKEKKTVHNSGGQGEQVGDGPALHEDLELDIDQLIFNTSS